MVIKRSEYEKILEEDHELDETADSIIDLDTEAASLAHRIDEADPKIHQLKIWSCFKQDISDLGKKEKYTIRLGHIRSGRTDFNIILEELDRNHISTQQLSEEGDITYVVLAYHNDHAEEAEKYISGLSFEEAELSSFEGTVEKNIDSP